MRIRQRERLVRLESVLFVPGLPTNLLSFVTFRAAKPGGISQQSFGDAEASARLIDTNGSVIAEDFVDNGVPVV